MAEAIKWYQKALAYEPNYADALNNFGVALTETGDFEQSCACFQKALTLLPDFAPCYSNLGNALVNMGRLDEAVDNLQKALALQPDYVDAHYNYAIALKKMDKLDEAIAIYRKALEYAPNHYGARVNLGNILKEKESFAAAVECFKQALLLYPDSFEALNNVGDILTEQGELHAGIAFLKKADALMPNNAKIYYNLGTATRELGKFDAALDYYQRALALDYDFDRTHVNFGCILYSLCLDYEKNKDKITAMLDQAYSGRSRPIERAVIELNINTTLCKNSQADVDKILQCMPPVEQETIANDQQVVSQGVVGTQQEKKPQMVALFHFGRSGSGYLHSLLDGHPNIITIPGNYMRGFFGKGVWEKITSKGYQGIPLQVAKMYEVVFDARHQGQVPPAYAGEEYRVEGSAEGFDKMGEDHDTSLVLDREKFIANLSMLLSQRQSVNHGQLFVLVNQAYELTLNNDLSGKKLILYHLHYNDPHSLTNFIRYFPQTQLLTIIRNPMQSCESWIMKIFVKQPHGYKAYAKVTSRIAGMLRAIDSFQFAGQNSVGIRLEDVKKDQKGTMGRLCSWLGIEEAPTLYESTMQGLKWWGDPTSSLFGRKHEATVWKDDPINLKKGVFFTEKDSFVFETFFYPLSARLGYVEMDIDQFRKDIIKIRPLLDQPFEFELELAKTFHPDYPSLQETEGYKSFHATLIARWHLLDKYGTYQNIMRPLP